MSQNVKEQAPSCPCGSGNSYIDCCRPYHFGKRACDAVSLMRSRYTAFVLNLPDYLIQTTHPANPQANQNLLQWKKSLSQFSRNALFKKLEVLDAKEWQDIATVTFTAYLSQKGQDSTFTERSYFEKFADQWLYRGGKVVRGHHPQLIGQSPLRILPLAYFGNPILQRKAQEISLISPSITTLIEEMIETMDISDGIGLAAPQVHHPIRLFIIRTPIENDRGQLDFGEVKVFINPVLLSVSDNRGKEIEGCLSIPHLRLPVERPTEGVIEYTTLEGKRLTESVSGWQARIIMHEYDHIEGILFIDRVSKEERAKIAPFLDSLQKRMRAAPPLSE